ncbi:hypothetical protein N0V90_011826 [Kalmusia sp. IMI 367209]|nr:hypothetical protein N0V90_011826 [Kalmusia sp. IMI 367209]
MDPNSNTSASISFPVTGQYWNPTGEYEYHDTVYTLTVYLPRRPPPRYLPSIFTREPLHVSPYHIIRPDDPSPNYDHFERRHLDDMKTKVVKIKSYRFPAELRCKHVQEKTSCEEGCYVLEKGGEIARWNCRRDDCEGHVYCGNVKKDEDRVACFGKKGQRIVCVDGIAA